MEVNEFVRDAAVSRCRFEGCGFDTAVPKSHFADLDRLMNIVCWGGSLLDVW